MSLLSKIVKRPCVSRPSLHLSATPSMRRMIFSDRPVLRKPVFELRRVNDARRSFSTVPVVFLVGTGAEEVKVDAEVGQSILEVAHKNNIELEGACEGSLACSTCHVILSQSVYDKLTPATDDENDMLDMAFGLTSTSRLGCQIKIDDSLSGMVIKIPTVTRNMMVDGHKPKH